MEENAIELGRHSLAHIMAAAVCSLYENVKLAIGPAIEYGCYYDFDLPHHLTEEDFSKIESKMKELIQQALPFSRREVSLSEAQALFAQEPYKLELLEQLPPDAVISVYHTGETFFDLCRGPHLESTRDLKPWGYKLHAVAGAYWRGDEKRPMLQRLYLYAFPTRAELKSHLAAVEEAIKRDHNKLGRALGYFTTVDCIGQGLPILLPKGAKVIRTLQRFVEDEEERRGYQQTMTPLMAKRELYQISGHWEHYRDGMFVLGDPASFEDPTAEIFSLRPMTCPFQFQAYLAELRSYRDLPLRYSETSTLFRNEASGEMHGLIRLRQFTISEGHIACRADQLEEEFSGCLDLANDILKTLGLYEDITFRFSKWDPQNREKYIGDPAQWEATQNAMRGILERLGVTFTEAEGEAAFYGPKLDFQIKNVFGKEDTLITIQIDFQLAERFDMTYVDTDGARVHPFVIHRTSVGCYERTLALLLEKYAGALPLWLAPEQFRILPISERHHAAAANLLSILREHSFRAQVDLRNETIGYKIRAAQKEKIPVMLLLGDKEMEDHTISLRLHDGTQQSDLSLEHFLALSQKRIFQKVISLKEI